MESSAEPREGSRFSPETLERRILGELGRALDIEPDSIDPHAPFERLGLSSALALELLGRLSELVGEAAGASKGASNETERIDSSVLWRCPTPSRLARHLAERLEGDGADPEQGGAKSRVASGRASGLTAGEVRGEPEPVAVVGLSCRFPGGPDGRSFWRLLSAGREALRDVPPDRWDGTALHDPDRSAPGRIITHRGYFLDRIDGFDAPFFHISPREARAMDPQQRLLLEVVWEAAEAAGLDPEALEGSATGVFVGALWSDYAALMVRSGPEAVGPHTATGLATSILSNRVSYALGLRGPSLTIDTACSSSLVAVHLACQSLALGDAELAFAGGVGIMSAADGMLMASKFGGLSPDGRSKAFAAEADGYGRGEGAGIVVLKPLSRALADGDPILALVRGSAVTNDGASNGLTAPNPEAQVEVLQRAYRRARVEPASVDYVEAHGTGTLLGDPIEASALGEVLGDGRPQDRPLRIGSVKTNVGHLEGAAGVAGLIKVVLSLAERELPPSLHFENPNPHIPFDRLGLEVNATARPWPGAGAEPGLAGVSSFGFGGTNCHLVVEGWTARRRGVLPAVAESRDELARMAAEAAGRLRREETTPAELVAEWADRAPERSGSADGEHRFALPFQGRLDLAERLEALAAAGAKDGTSVVPAEREPVVFLFPGHGSQWAGMGMRLYQSEPVYRRTLDQIESLFRDVAGWSLLDEMWVLGEGSRIESAEVSIPSLFATQVGLGRLWRSWGVEPGAYLGHSHGEIAAAQLGGALRLEDAVALVYHLGQLYARIFAYDSMLVVPLAPEAAEELLVGRENEVGVAVHHMPEATVLSGRPETLRQIASELDTRGLRTVVPRVHAAPHSPLVEPLMEDLAELLGDFVPLDGLDAPLISTLTGDVVAASELGADHWVAAMRRPALFTEAVEGLATRGGSGLFLELSAHPILGRAVVEIYKRSGRSAQVLGSMRAGADGGACLRESAADLFLLGHDPDWRAVAGIERSAEPVLVTLSARDQGALREAAERWRELVIGPDGRGAALADLAYTSTVRRAHLGHRLAVVAAGREELADRLGRFAGGETPRGVSVGKVAAAGSARGAGPVFLFSGQGSQWPGMGRTLLEHEPCFREVVEECDAIFRRLAGESLLPLLAADPEEGTNDEPAETTRTVQPALFALQVGLAALWRSRGIVPEAVVGHSVGEVAAATVAGALGLEQGLAVIDHRSRLMERASGRGSMADVRLPADELRRLLEPYGDRLSVAAENAPGRTVVAGETHALEELLDELRRRRVACRALRVDCAFHSAQMEPARRELEAALADLAPGPLAIPMVSTVTGEPVTGEELDAAYWGRALRDPVLFAPAIERVAPDRVDRFLEIGPHGSLVGYVEETVLEAGREAVAIPSMRKGRDARESLLEATGRLYVDGAALDLGALHPHRRRVVETPSYPWQRQRYWLDRAPVSGAEAWKAMAGRPDPVYEIEWRDLGAVEAPERAGEGSPGGRRWLVVGAGGALSPRVVEAIRRRGDLVEVVDVTAEGAGAPAQLRRLVVTGLADAEPSSTALRVVHLAAADLAGKAVASPAEPAIHRRLTGSLLHLLQGAVDAGHGEGLPGRIEVWTVTRGATAAAGSASEDAVLQAPLWGLGRTAAFEHGELWGGMVDLDPEEDPGEGGDREAAALVSLVAASAPDREQSAVRGGRRLVPRLVSVSPSEAAPTPGGASRPVSPDGVVLVTGGLGALGLEVASWLVERGARHLALVGRSAPSAAAAGRIEALEAAGARVTVAQADVTDAGAMAAVLDGLGSQHENGHGPIPLRGVIHAAGITDDGPLAGLEWERVWRVMAAKVAGAWVLHELTHGEELEFFVLFSSAAAFGNGGQAPYAAGNAALDALAHHRREQGLPAVSMAWGPWTAGMAVADGNGSAPRRWADLGIRPFEPRRALGLLDRFRDAGPPHVLFFDADWQRFGREPHVARAWGPLLAELDGTVSAVGAVQARGADAGAGAAGEPPARPSSLKEMVAYLRRVAAEILGAPNTLPTDRDFQELGVDSLMVGEVVTRLRRDLELPVFPRELFDHPTIDTLAAHLWQELDEAAADTDTDTDTAGEEAPSTGPFKLCRWADAPPEPASPKRRGPGAVLLVSSPRSGSTLLRVMLAGHPGLFSPPELHLLGFESLAERQRTLDRTGLTEGLERALMELTGEPLDEVRERLEGWAGAGLPITDVYRRLDRLAGDRMLVDKSPSYAADAGALQRAEAWLDAPRILHLVRHPFAVIDSFVRNRMHELIAASGVDPHALAEDVWTTANANLLEWSERLPRDRYLRVSFEDLVRRPKPVLEDICRFLGVSFRKEVLTPYEGERMTDGVTQRSLPVGDTRFHEHEGINPQRAEAWREVALPRPLGFEARRVARRLGYSLDRDGATEPSTGLAAAPVSANRSGAGERTERLIAVRGLDLCLSEWGGEENPLVLCVHGFLDQGASWQPVAEQLAGAGYRVVAPDLRGHGRSSHLPPGVHYDVADSLADIEALRRQLGRTSFTLVGHSFGASLAALYAGLRPEVVERLVLVEPVSFADATAQERVSSLTAHLERRVNGHNGHRQITRLPDLATAADRMRAIHTGLPPGLAYELAQRATRPVPEGGLIWCHDPALLDPLARSFDGETFRELVARIRAPVTILQGLDSDHTSADRMWMRTIRRRTSWSIVVAPGGHNLHLEASSEVAAAVSGRPNAHAS